ncbi:MAG: hypothetical protein LUI06_08350 [Ruminococcus sp.]|nr:hypothetical protein [Ruminococcus sp.]
MADDVMSRLSQALSDPQTMQQVNSVLSQLTGGNAEMEASTQAAASSSPSPDISSMLSSLLAQNSTAQPVQTNAAPSDSGFDMGKLMQIGSMLSSSGENDQNVALLLALKPLLKNESQAKVDRIVRIFKVLAAYPLLRDSGLLGGDLFG